MKGLIYLLDPGEIEHVLTMLDEWANNSGSPAPLSESDLRREIIVPLEEWLQKKSPKFLGNTATEAAVHMLVAVHDVIDCISHDDLPAKSQEAIGRLGITWKNFQISIGWAEIFRSVRRQEAGGVESGKVRREEAEARYRLIIDKANQLLESGRPRRELAGIISARTGLTPRQIRTILKKAGI